MFYENQSSEDRHNYIEMLSTIGSLTLLFGDTKTPYLPYRAHENIFCKYFKAENLARHDCSVDAKKGRLGIGLKTWTGSDSQKIAEFGRLHKEYKGLTGIELVKAIAGYRNQRIRITENMHGLKELIYHIVRRVPNAMQIIEYPFDYIDIDKISIIENRGSVNNTYFTDGKHTYHFSISKNTLYMIFDKCNDDYKILEEFNVEISPDPYASLASIDRSDIWNEIVDQEPTDYSDKLCLRLYTSSKKGGKQVAPKSGLNQCFAGGRERNSDEVYIPYPAEDRRRSVGFFPSPETPFRLKMPDETIISAKVCQAGGKAIMSNPNKLLGEWLLRKVFEVPSGKPMTYEMLERFGVDCVVFTKLNNLEYKIDFAQIGTYEKYLQDLNDEDEHKDLN